MAEAKYLKQESGRLKEATGVNESTGVADAGKLIETDATGRIDNSLMPVGVGTDTAIIVASETLLAGDFVNIWNDSGTAKVRKADASTAGREAQGFVLAGVALGANATVYFEGQNTQRSGMTPGDTQFLSATNAGLTSGVAPSATGEIVQILGRAITATAMTTEMGQSIELA